MAEHVENHMESMAQEIREMRGIKLFTEEETRIIISKRREFEYKINGVTKHLQDFKDYINYEKAILKDIKIRRNKHRIMEKKNVIEFKISKRIKYLYGIALQRFSNDYQLSLAYFKFCKDFDYQRAASQAIQTILKTFAHREDVWKEAADWYMKKDLNQALTAVYRGLAIHKKSSDLIYKAVDLELKNVKPEKEVQALCAKRLETIVTSMIEENQYKFVLEILQILTPHPFTSDIQKTIVKWLLEAHKNEELVWQAVAEREFNGHHLDKPSTQTSPEYRLQKCIETYEKGLSKICTENKSALWCMYLDFLIEYHFRPDQSVPIDKKAVISALERSNQFKRLTDRYFVVWAQLLDDEAKVVEVIENGLEVVPDSVELWKLRLKYAFLKDDVAQFNSLLKRGTDQLKEKSLPMWTMALRYHSLNSSEKVIEDIYEQVITKKDVISDIFKPDYIEWLALTKGIDHARAKYEELSKKPPYCKELYIVMARLESLEVNPDIDRWERVLKTATEHIRDDIDLWKLLIDLYLRQHGEFDKKRKNFSVDSEIIAIYRRAEYAVKNDELVLANWKKEFEELRRSIENNNVHEEF